MYGYSQQCHYSSVKNKNEKFSLGSDSCENLNSFSIIRTAASQNKSNQTLKKKN